MIMESSSLFSFATAASLIQTIVVSIPAYVHATNSLKNKPNVIIILNDDQGYSDLSCYGAKDIYTPNIDKLADTGIKFTDFYVASSVSSASRASLLTGCYPQRVGVRGVFFPTSNNGLSPEYMTIAEMLKEVGYSTAAVGKWHLGDNSKFLPTNQGFDSYYGIPYSNDMYPSKLIPYDEKCLFRDGYSEEKIKEEFAKSGNLRPANMQNKVPLVRNTKCIEFPCDQSTITERYADEGIKFIKESVKSETPFFLYLANSMPHIPIYVSDKFKGSSTRGLYGDAIQEIDYNVGRIISVLEDLDIRKNTIIVILSDNGPWLAVGKDAGSSLPLFEGKFTSFEGGFRVPAIISWPSVLQGGQICREVVSSMDIFPTLAYLVGGKTPQYELDGKNIFELLNNPTLRSPHEDYYMVYDAAAIRSGNWKFHAEGMVYQVKKTARDEKGPALYNLKNDIGETVNLINTYPELADSMNVKLENYRKNIKIIKCK